MVSLMCEEDKIARQTNHSLHVTGTTSMFCANISEKVIHSHTCHLSLKAVQMYEKP